MVQGDSEPAPQEGIVAAFSFDKIEAGHRSLAKGNRHAVWQFGGGGVGFADAKHESAFALLRAICAANHIAVQEKTDAAHHPLFRYDRAFADGGAHSLRQRFVMGHDYAPAKTACGPPSGISSNTGLLRSSGAHAGALLA